MVSGDQCACNNVIVVCIYCAYRHFHVHAIVECVNVYMCVYINTVVEDAHRHTHMYVYACVGEGRRRSHAEANIQLTGGPIPSVVVWRRSEAKGNKKKRNHLRMLYNSSMYG